MRDERAEPWASTCGRVGPSGYCRGLALGLPACRGRAHSAAICQVGCLAYPQNTNWDKELGTIPLIVFGTEGWRFESSRA